VNAVLGTGRIGGRRLVVCGDDLTVRGGVADAAIHAKQVYCERMARELRRPIVRLVDATGGGGSVKTYEQTGRTYVPGNPGCDLVAAMLSEVPVLAAALGPVVGLGVARVAHSHFSVMVRGVSQVFVAGPPVVERAFGTPVGEEELEGSCRRARRRPTIPAAATSRRSPPVRTGGLPPFTRLPWRRAWPSERGGLYSRRASHGATPSSDASLSVSST
jgi:acetyl-CoA carboxylase carboxyltransferase component